MAHAFAVGLWRVEAHVADGLDAEGLDEGEHAIDGMKGGGDTDAFVDAEPAEFACVGEADAAGCVGGPGEEAAAGEALAVEDGVVVGESEGAEPGAEGAGDAGPPPRSELAAGEANDIVDHRMGADGVDEGVLHEPVDFRVRVSGAEAGEDRDRTADITQRAGADDEDAFEWPTGVHGGDGMGA